MDINDGKYAGELTPEQVIEQFEYRIGIHETYIELLAQYPGVYDVSFGNYAFQMWAINGYSRAIQYLKEGVSQELAKFSLSALLAEAISRILKWRKR